MKILLINRMTTAWMKQFTFIKSICYTFFEIMQEVSSVFLKNF